MAAPTAPTASTIVSEALAKAGYTNPTTGLTTRATDYWLEEIKNDILVVAKGKKLRSLYTHGTTVTVDGKSRYSCPSDYFSDLTVEILDGTHTGTAQDGAVGSITLAAAEDATDITGSLIIITGGTGVGCSSNITSFSTTTMVATVAPNFATAPAAASTYMVVDTLYPLTRLPIDQLRTSDEIDRGIPEKFAEYGDSTYGEFELFPVPYRSSGAVYGLRYTYYANLLTLDLTGTLLSTLYTRWRSLWVQGVYAKALQDMDDSNAKIEDTKYWDMISAMISTETYSHTATRKPYVNEYY